MSAQAILDAVWAQVQVAVGSVLVDEGRVSPAPADPSWRGYWGRVVGATVRPTEPQRMVGWGVEWRGVEAVQDSCTDLVLRTHRIAVVGWYEPRPVRGDSPGFPLVSAGLDREWVGMVDAVSLHLQQAVAQFEAPGIGMAASLPILTGWGEESGPTGTPIWTCEISMEIVERTKRLP